MGLKIQTERNNLLRVKIMKQFRWHSFAKIAVLFPAHAATLMFAGCCVSTSNSVRNETDKDLSLTVVRQSQPFEVVVIRASSSGRVNGMMLTATGQPPISWIISDGQSRFTYTDISPIATMPREFVSGSRFTSDFPCKRFTQHVAITPDMAIHAVRVIGYTESEPPPFPIHYTKKENER